MKICEIATGYTPVPAQMGAATEIVVEELTRAFLEIGEDVEILDISAADRAATDLPITEIKVPSVFTKKDVSLGIMHKVKRVVYSVALAMKLKKLLKKANGKVVLHFHNQYNMFFFLKLVPESLRSKAHCVYTNHSHIWHGDWEDIKDTIKSRYFQEVFCLQNADCVFVLNENTKSNLINHIGIDESKIHLIDNGVNTDIYKILDQNEKARAKSNYGVADKKVFVQVGSVCERKNQLGALKLLLPLMKQDKSVTFCYAGGIISEEYQQSIAKFAQKNGVANQVFYVGELTPGKELNEFYNIAQAMIFPSKAEGFSLVIIEAMAAGVPVFVTEQLQFKLADGCIRFKDESDFIAKANGLCDDLAPKIREIVINSYSWQKIATDYKKYF